MYSQLKQNTKHFCTQTSFEDNLERIEMVHSIQVVHSPELYIISSKRSYVAQPDRMEKYWFHCSHSASLNQFCAVFVRFVMWMMSYVPMMTLPIWPLLWIGLGPSISALICCDVIVMLLLNALASILCSLTNCLCEPCTRLKLTKPKHAKTSLFIGHTIRRAMEG